MIVSRDIDVICFKPGLYEAVNWRNGLYSIMF
jgi:hypothetical protein